MEPTALEVLAMDDLILGRGVKRGRHEVTGPLADVFRERLATHGFRPRLVSEIEIEVGVRVPAWLLRDDVADFGVVFWEVFTPRAKRKLFASQVRNAKGDWEIQLLGSAREPVFVNLELAESYDASRPVGLY